MKFRKKPVVIDAVQWKCQLPDATKNNFREIKEFCGDCCRLDTFHGLFIVTLEGPLRASPGDWIIRGVAGEFYPCKPAIFAKTYEIAEPHVDTPTT